MVWLLNRFKNNERNEQITLECEMVCFLRFPRVFAPKLPLLYNEGVESKDEREMDGHAGEQRV